jgi:hypothetical protein
MVLGSLPAIFLCQLLHKLLIVLSEAVVLVEVILLMIFEVEEGSLVFL